MKPKVYIETTIISYLASKPSRDLITAAHQQITHEWWETRLEDFCVRPKDCWEAQMTHWRDPVVEEVRRIRDQQAAELDYDLKAIFERARRRQKQSKHKTVSFANAAKTDNPPPGAEAKSVRG